jgi:hypothetical protein
MVQKVPSPASKLAVEGSLLGFTITLRAESRLLESELLFGNVAQVFVESRVYSEKQRSDWELTRCKTPPSCS